MAGGQLTKHYSTALLDYSVKKTMIVCVCVCCETKG